MTGLPEELSPAVQAEQAGLPQRLREARRRAGLSQAEAGDGQLTGSYVSLLESGRRRPTPAALTVLAARLGCSVDYLFHGQDPAHTDHARLLLDYADLALRNGDPAATLSQLGALHGDQSLLSEADRWRARRLRARALEGSGRLEEAVREIESLRKEAVEEHRYDEHLRLTVDVVRCYKEAGDVAYALDIGESALSTLGLWGMTGTDAHADLASTVVGAYYERGDLVRAEAVAAEVLAILDEGGSTRARAAVHWNASLLAERRDDLPAALQLAERALAVYAESDDDRALARLRVAYAWLQLRCLPPRPEAARQNLLASRTILADVGSEIDLVYCETELARCELLLGRPREALELAEASRARLGDAPRLEQAHTTLVRARALLALGRRDDAVAAYRDAGGTLASLDLAKQAAAAWRELADAFTELGLFEDAALAYQQALTDAGVRAAPDVTYSGTRVPGGAARPEASRG